MVSMIKEGVLEDLNFTTLYRSEVEQMKEELERVLKDLKRSVPFYSTRYRVSTCSAQGALNTLQMAPKL